MHAGSPPATQTTSDDRRARRVFTLILAVYLAGMALAASTGYRSASKAIALPAILLFAVATNRFRSFTREWLVFLAATVLFDGLRALIFSATVSLEWPIYLNYAIEWDRALLGGEVAPSVLQAWLGSGSEPGPFDHLMIVVHGSHFVYFLLFCLGIWCFAPADFPRCRRSMMLLMALGLVCYLAFPTVPPHIADRSFAAIPPIHWVRGEIYQQAVPKFQFWFDTNPIAAMPSLHAAFPALCAFIAAYHLRWRAWPFFAYALCVDFAIMYLGEHYAVDVLAGIALAFFCFGVFYPVGGRSVREHLGALRERWGRQRVGTGLVRPALLAFPLFLAAELSETLATEWRNTLWIHPGFVARELDGLPAARDLFLANHAFERRNFRVAARHYERALAGLDGEHSSRAQQALARSASQLEPRPDTATP